MQWISELERERGGEEENREYQTPNEGNKEISVDASVWAYVCVCVREWDSVQMSYSVEGAVRRKLPNFHILFFRTDADDVR